MNNMTIMIQELVKEIKKIKPKPKKILLQLPEGLKTKAVEIMEALEREKINVILASNPCYGACDLPEKEAKMLGCDLIVHVGHNRFYKNIKTKTPVLYFPWKMNANIDDIDFSIVKEAKIGLLSSVQYLDLLKKVSEKLKAIGKKPVIGGQILGCWTENANKIAKKVDAFLFVGTGEFHPLALSEKKAYILDLEKRKISILGSSLFKKQRYARIFAARDAQTFGILVSSKLGQFNMKMAEKIKKMLEQRHKKAFILIMDEINEQKLAGIKADAFINTACPRITDDKFSKPMINACDIEKLFED
jgi:2-(3-amino-3-carboxypropyl)histidine synthase